MNRRRIKISRLALSSAILVLLLWVPFPSLTAQTKDTATLTVRITGARNSKGKNRRNSISGRTGFSR